MFEVGYRLYFCQLFRRNITKVTLSKPLTKPCWQPFALFLFAQHCCHGLYFKMQGLDSGFFSSHKSLRWTLRILSVWSEWLMWIRSLSLSLSLPIMNNREREREREWEGKGWRVDRRGHSLRHTTLISFHLRNPQLQWRRYSTDHGLIRPNYQRGNSPFSITKILSGAYRQARIRGMLGYIQKWLW